MKGLIVLVLFALSLAVSMNAEAAQSLKGKQIKALKTNSGKVFENLSIQESSKVLESLESEENIEIREEVIYPEEVTEIVVGRLTKARIVEKRPNPKDYN